jgi:hypothetical protein
MTAVAPGRCSCRLPSRQQQAARKTAEPGSPSLLGGITLAHSLCRRRGLAARRCRIGGLGFGTRAGGRLGQRHIPAARATTRGQGRQAAQNNRRAHCGDGFSTFQNKLLPNDSSVPRAGEVRPGPIPRNRPADRFRGEAIPPSSTGNQGEGSEGGACRQLATGPHGARSSSSSRLV